MNNAGVSKVDRVFQQAFAAHQAGKLDEAGKLYRRVLSETPADMETLYLFGTLCSQQGRYDDAAKYLGKALAIEPNHLAALNSMGLTLKGQRKLLEAAACYRRAIALQPDYADAYSNLGEVLELLGELDEAESNLRRALQLNPNAANAYCSLGVVLKRKDQFEEAAQCLLRGIELRPDFALAYNDLGGIYKLWGRLDQAMACFDRALLLSPDFCGACNNKGTVLEELGRLDEAFVAFERAVAMNPEDLTARSNIALLYLRQGVLDRGWEAYDLRLKGGSQVDRFPYPSWDGGSLEGKTILVYAEQGLGDEIFFASCLPDLIARARHCVVECEPRLAPLLARAFPTATIQGAARHDINWIFNMPKIDVQVAAGSLARFLRPTLDSFPTAPAYLYADPHRVDYWRSRLAALGTELKVGICWRSGLASGERYKQYSQLTQWGSIFGVPGVHFINLQYDECAAELRAVEDSLGVTVTAFPELDMRNEIDETAALIASLDVVISAGTAVAEIAGALGVEVLRLDFFGKSIDALGTDRIPWHPTTSLFGQKSLGDWEPPIASIAESLREKVDGGLHAVEYEYVQLPDGAALAVDGSLNDLSTYVLKEQHGWFDPEYDFVLGLAGPGSRCVDIGAGVGAYAIPLARRSAGGRLLAITQTAAETTLLQQSRLRNQLEGSIDVAIAGAALALDSEMDKQALGDVGFVRIAHAMCNQGVLAGGAQFFSANSPLVMFGIKPGQEFDFAVSGWFLAHGYGLYRLVPGLGVLVPFASINELDVYALNLFACKPDRAEALGSQGILLRQFHTLDNLPGIDLGHWQEYLAAMPYATDLLPGWTGTQSGEKDWEVYWMALNLFALAKSDARGSAERYACLLAADGVMTALVQEHANIPRLLTLCRVWTELGKREAAVGLLNRICELLHGGVSSSLDEPCLALTEAFARTSPHGKVADWTVAMILTQREALRAFSNYFTGKEALPVLQEIQASGFGGDDIARRIMLIETRFGAA